MKVAVLILLVAVAGAFAEDAPAADGPPPFKCTDNKFVCTFKELGHKIKYHATKLGGKLADVGTSVLGAAIDQGKGLLASSAQAVLGTVLEHLNKEGLVGKREANLLDQVKEHLKNGAALIQKAKDGLHSAFKTGIAKIMGVMKNTAALTKVDADADKQIDDAVAEYEKEGKKGFFGLAKTIAGKMRDIFKAGMDKLKAAYGKKVEERALLDNIKAAWEKTKSGLSGAAGAIADTFKPHLDALKSGIAALGDKVKEHGSNLVTAAKGSFDDLKTKLSGHIDTLKGHAQNIGGHVTTGLNALKEALASIASQTVDNVKGTLGDAASTTNDATKTLVDHVADAISGN